MKFRGEKNDYRYGFEFFYKPGMNPHIYELSGSQELKLTFQIYGSGSSSLRYLKALLPEIPLSCTRLLEISTEGAAYIEGRENVVTALEIILTSNLSFLDQRNAQHKKFFNDLVEYLQEITEGASKIKKLDLSEEYKPSGDKPKVKDENILGKFWNFFSSSSGSHQPIDGKVLPKSGSIPKRPLVASSFSQRLNEIKQQISQAIENSEEIKAEEVEKIRNALSVLDAAAGQRPPRDLEKVKSLMTKFNEKFQPAAPGGPPTW